MSVANLTALSRFGRIFMRRTTPSSVVRPLLVHGPVNSLVMLVVALSLVGAGCDGSPFSRSKACTLIGCHDQFSATVVASSAALPPGQHTVTVTTEAGALSCSFGLPLEMTAGGGTVSPSCPLGLRVDVAPDTVCTETVTDAARILRCDPIPGMLKEIITLSSTPSSVRVQQSVAGTTILDRSVTPTYKNNRPNGPECEPLCRQAGVEWTLP